MTVVGAAHAQVILRPQRIAYLIPHEDWSQFDSVVAYASTEWGGCTQPIIPVKPPLAIDELWKEMLDALKPEVFIDYTGFDDALMTDWCRAYGAQRFDSTRLDRGDEPGATVGTVIRSDEPATRAAGPNSSRLARMALGVVQPEHAEYWRGRVAIMDTPQPAEVAIAQMDESSVLARSKRGCDAYEVTNWFFDSRLAVVATDDFSFNDAIVSWNIRARTPVGGGDCWFIHPDALNDQRVRGFLEQRVLNKTYSEPDIFFTGGEEKISEVLEQWGWRPHTGDQFRSHVGTRERDLAENPILYRIGPPVARALVTRRREGIRRIEPVTLVSPTSTLRALVDLPGYQVGGRCRVDIRDVPEWTWPDSEAVGDAIIPNAACKDGALTLVTSTARQIHLTPAVIDSSEVLTTYLGERGFEGRLSDKGRLASALIEHLGSTAALDALASDAALKIVAGLASPSRKRLLQRIRKDMGGELSEEELLKRLKDIVFSDEVWRSREQMTSVGLPALELDHTLEKLVRARIVRRALKHECPRCRLTSYVQLAMASEPLRCQGCGLEELAGTKLVPDFTFALNMLAARVEDQGVLPNLLTLRWLQQSEALAAWYPGYDLEHRDSGKQFEVDVLGLSHSRVSFAEAKESAAGVSTVYLKGQVDRAKSAGAGLVVFSALDDWPEETGSDVVNFQESGLEIRLLGRRDLIGPV